MKKPEDKYFRGVVKLEECIIEELVDKEDLLDGPDTSASSLSDTAAKPGSRQVLKSNSSLGQAQTLAFRITNKTPYKSVVKGEPPLPPPLHPMWPLPPGAAPGDLLVRCSTWCLPPAGPGQRRPALQCWPPPGLLSLSCNRCSLLDVGPPPGRGGPAPLPADPRCLRGVRAVHNSLLLRAENPAEKQEWVSKMRTVAARASGAKEVESDADSGYDNEVSAPLSAASLRPLRCPTLLPLLPVPAARGACLAAV
jgi:hypothetical protein